MNPAKHAAMVAKRAAERAALAEQVFAAERGPEPTSEQASAIERHYRGAASIELGQVPGRINLPGTTRKPRTNKTNNGNRDTQ